MAKDHITDYDTTAGNNTDVDGVSIAEGTAPSNINDAIRELMSHLAEWYTDIGGGTSSGGSAGAYTLTTQDAVAAYAQDQFYVFEANHAMPDTATATLNVNAIGAKPLRKNVNVQLRANDIKAQQICMVAYENTTDAFHLLNPAASNEGVEIIANGSLSAAASLIFTDLSTTYRAYLLAFDNLVPATNNIGFELHLSDDNGVSYKDGASDNYWVVSGTLGGGTKTAIVDAKDSDSRIAIAGANGIVNAATGPCSGHITIYNPAQSGERTNVTSHVVSTEPDASDAQVEVWGGGRNAATADDAVRFRASSGNITTMRYTLYGFRAS